MPICLCGKITTMLLLSYHDIIEWLKGFMLNCPSKKWLHIDCPGCGFQRSFFALTEGDIVKSFNLYPATLPILVLSIFTILHLKYKFDAGALVIKIFFILIAIIILAFYIYKIINQKLFC